MLDSITTSLLNPLQGEKAPNPLKLAVLPVTLEAVQGALYLPVGYQFVSVVYDEQYRVLKFLVSSEELPEVQEGCALPNINLHIKMEYAPENYQFRRITSEVRQ